MPHSDIKLSFHIDAWHANAIGLSTQQDWQHWSQNQQWPTEGKAEVSAIPAMMRRRMSSLSKLAVQTSLELLSEHHVDYLVFASRHGELARSAKLIEDILAGEEASPMAFSQSVHNTAAGLATIASKKPIPLTSIAAGDNTFQSAILEAWLHLASHPQDKVMVIDFDEPVPEVYHQYEQHNYRGYAIGLVLSAGNQISVATSTPQPDEAQLPQGLDFLAKYLAKKPQWSVCSQRQTWTWQRND